MTVETPLQIYGEVCSGNWQTDPEKFIGAVIAMHEHNENRTVRLLVKCFGIFQDWVTKQVRGARELFPLAANYEGLTWTCCSLLNKPSSIRLCSIDCPRELFPRRSRSRRSPHRRSPHRGGLRRRSLTPRRPSSTPSKSSTMRVEHISRLPPNQPTTTETTTNLRGNSAGYPLVLTKLRSNPNYDIYDTSKPTNITKKNLG